MPDELQEEESAESAARERRRRERVAERFPASLLPAFISGGLGAVRGEVRDLDAEGFVFESDRPLKVGQRFRAAFKVPKALNEPFQGMPIRMPARVRAVRETDRDGAPYDVVLEWESPLHDMLGKATRRHVYQIFSIIFLLIGAICYLKVRSLMFFWYSPMAYIYSILVATYLLTRFGFAIMHKNPELRDYTPSISIVISVRNEQDAIGRTLDTCYAADYPDHLREVIVCNDGSTDGTGRVLEQYQKKYPALKVFTLPPSGKRHGMATGVRNAVGEIVVFVDSDTFLYPSALRRIVCGFEDRSLGAVAGHCEVENKDVNLLTAMQDVRFYLSFKLMKTAESVFGLVTCCPGCLSAYRKEYLLKILDPWLNQMFLGAPATFGDDRSLTNYILRDYRVIYNETAICTTLVPENMKRFMTQQVRWKKSWLRETLRAGRFIFSKHPVGAASWLVTSVCSVLSPLLCFKLLLFTISYHEAGALIYLSGLFLIGLLQSLYVLAKRPHCRWLIGPMLLVIIQVFLMGPQTYYAILTWRKNHWGTR
jgi:hyaluronan synthase